jgi:hypothetical protein
VTGDQPARGTQRQQTNDGIRGGPQREAPRPGGGRFAHQHGLAQDYPGDEPAEEIAAALLRPQGGRAPLVEAEGARHDPGQPIDRRAFLRA